MLVANYPLCHRINKLVFISFLYAGLGYTAVVAAALCCVYYVVLVAYILFYLFASFTSELPWATCGNSWNTDRCMVRAPKLTDNLSKCSKK